MNLPMPPAGEPTLMRFSDVVLFHEFVTAAWINDTNRLSNIFGRGRATDYTEFPAQILSIG